MADRRRRASIVDDLEEIDTQLRLGYNKVMQEEMGALVKELGRANREYRREDDTSGMREEFIYWCRRHQGLLDKENAVSKAWAATPREKPVDFEGENVRAFWNHLQASVMRNPALDNRQKMAHFVSRVKDQKDAAALVAGFAADGTELDACLAAFQAHYLDEKALKVEALKRAEEVQPLPHNADQAAISAFLTEVRVLQAQLKDSAGQQYLDIAKTLVSKLTVSTRKRFYEKLTDRCTTAETLAGSDKDSQATRSSDFRKEAPILECLVEFLERERSVAGWQRFLEGKPAPEEKERRRADSPDQGQFPHKRARARVLTTNTARCINCQAAEHDIARCKAKSAEERYRCARDSGLCLRCLKHPWDPKRPCRQSRPCRQCGQWHHPAVCTQSSRRVHLTWTNSPEAGEAGPSVVGGPSGGVYISAVSALILQGNSTVSINVLLDTAAETTLLLKSTAERAGLRPSHVEPFALVGVTEGSRIMDQLVTLTVAAKDRSFQIDLAAHITPVIVEGRLRAPTSELRRLAREKGVPLEESTRQSKTVDLLIGQDWLFPFLARRMVPLGPFIGALQSPLGWYIAGREGGPAVRGTAVQLTCQQLCQDLARIYEYVEPEETRMIEESAPKTTITYDKASRSYSVTLPRKSLEGLGDNRRNAWAQVMALKRKLLANGKYKEYDQAIKEYLVQSFAEIAPPLGPHQPAYIIPHHAVWKKDAAKTKCRIVFNASSAVPGQLSLNQCLSKGESINADIWAVTLRFRLAPIVLATDLMKAFLQIRVEKNDRDLQRYFWFENQEDKNPKEYRMNRVIFGAASSPYLLGAVLQEHTKRFKEEFPAVAEQMGSAMYMDDGFFVASTVEEAEEIMDQAEKFFAEASFQLHPWLSNERAIEKPGRLVGDSGAEQKSLGLLWLPQADTFRVKPVGATDAESVVKRRQALSLLAQLYDPLNLFAPLKTRIRLFLREMASAGDGWDTVLSAEEKRHFNLIKGELTQAAEVNIPRTIKALGALELHVFGDASVQAYGVVAYLFDRASGDQLLLGAKLKLAPKKFRTKNKEESQRVVPQATIPRLELMAAVMAARLVGSLLPLLPPQTPVALYSDSEITLKRIQGDINKQAPFEMRRLHAILELTAIQQWHYIPSCQNPADLLTRDMAAKKWLASPLWWKGRDLRGSPWPTPTCIELKGVWLTQTNELTAEEKDICQSNWTDAVKGMEAMIQAEWKDGSDLESLNEGKERRLDEPSYVRMRLWSLVQRELFPSDFGRLQAGQMPAERSRLRQLDPFVDEWGLIRRRRPAQPQSVDWETRHPVILGSHPLVRQLVRTEHEALGHAGEAMTRSHLAQYYHLLQARRLIKGVVRPCHQCNIQRGRAFRPPEPTLPSFRTEHLARPFSYIGLDHFGPLKIRSASKVYGLIFTCAVTRAIHLEVVTKLNGQQCINALKRFFARRGVPREIHSDNGRAFVASNKALAKLADLVADSPTHPEVEALQIKWIFQTPKAPWFGAFFERMVGVSKRVLEQTNLRKSSSLDDIRTIVTQVEAIVNSRPLIEADEEGHVALTPAHFLIGTSLLALPPVPSSNGHPDPGRLLQHYQEICEDRALIQTRLQREYLTELRRHHSVRNPTREPVVGEWVLVSGEDILGLDRFGWPVEQVKEVFRDEDGQVRRARISWRGGTRLRPVRSLVPLEGLHSESPETEGSTPPAAGARECGERDAARQGESK